MIIWIASYPKSGNTLIRSILGTYFFSDDGIFDFKHTYRIGQFPVLEHFKKLNIDTSNREDVFRNYVQAQEKFNHENPRIKFYKTHSLFFDRKDHSFSDLKNTLGAVYVVRDPRNVVTSFAHHYGVSLSEATKQICNNDLFSGKTDQHPEVFISSWKLNYLTWKSLGKKVLIIKYEDLIGEKKKTELLKIFKFFETLGMNKSSFNIAKLNKVIKTTEFTRMKSLEKKIGFDEASIDSKTGKTKAFFNLGPKNNWRNNLTDEIRIKIENEFKKEMIELGYL